MSCVRRHVAYASPPTQAYYLIYESSGDGGAGADGGHGGRSRALGRRRRPWTPALRVDRNATESVLESRYPRSGRTDNQPTHPPPPRSHPMALIPLGSPEHPPLPGGGSTFSYSVLLLVPMVSFKPPNWSLVLCLCSRVGCNFEWDSWKFGSGVEIFGLKWNSLFECFAKFYYWNTRLIQIRFYRISTYYIIWGAR